MTNETVWLPDGYGIGTIIYSLTNEPYEATKLTMGAEVGIYEIMPVDKDYAIQRIAQGAKKLVSVK